MRGLYLLLRKDLASIYRAPGQLAGLCTFVLVVVLLASVGVRQVGVSSEELQRMSAALLWVVNAFSAVLALQAVALIEERDGGGLGVLLGRAESSLLFFSKWLSALLLLFFLQTVALAAGTLFLSIPIAQGLAQCLEVMLLSSATLSGIGVLISSITVSLPSREMILPVLLFPLALPLLCASMILFQSVFERGGFERFSFWYMMLLCSLVLILSLGSFLYEQVIR